MRNYFEEMNIDYDELKRYEDIETYYDEVQDFTKLINELQCDRVEALKQIVNKNKEIERLNKEKENLTNIVANKIIKDYDIETPLKEELNKERLKNVVLSDENNRLNNIINETKKILLLNFDTTTTIFNALNKLSEVDK